MEQAIRSGQMAKWMSIVCGPTKPVVHTPSPPLFASSTSVSTPVYVPCAIPLPPDRAAARAKAEMAIASAVAVPESILERRVMKYVESNVNENTADTYKSAVNGWSEWCKAHRWRDDDCSAVRLAAYIKSLGERGIAASTIKGFLPALRNKYKFATEWENNTRHVLVKQVQEIACTLAGPSNPMLPITWEMVKRVTSDLVQKSQGGKKVRVVEVRNVCMLVLQHTLTWRAVEMVALIEAEVWLESRVVGTGGSEGADVNASSSSESTGEERVLKAYKRKSKTDQAQQGDMSTVSCRWGISESVLSALSSACPARWLLWFLACKRAGKYVPPPVEWSGLPVVSIGGGLEEIRLPRQEAKQQAERVGLSSLSSLSRAPALFTRCDKQSASKPHLHLSVETVAKAYKGMMGGIGLDSKGYASHSARSGGTTAAWAGGADTLAVKAHGGWKSNAYESYIRQDASSKARTTKHVRE